MVSFGAPDDSGPAVEAPRDARQRELEARVYGGADPSPADVAELRDLLAPPDRHRSGGSALDEVARGHDAVDPASRDRRGAEVRGDERRARAHRPHERPARAWLAGGAVAIVLAALIGAGATTSILGSRSGAEPVGTTSAAAAVDQKAVMPVSPMVIGASSPATGVGPAAEAEALSAHYFDQAQSTGDRPPVDLPGIVPSSTRRVFADWGQQPGQASLWVARGRDKSFCVIASIDASHAGSSCTPADQAAAAGVRVSVATAAGGTIEATWNLSSGLLELTMFPSGTTVISSGALPPTP
ncbi:MAG: hypothetical protein JWP75_2411 [Frondihabitans sp.]|nr:hypothetical protein [Frondihabitans sp.]